MSDFPFLGEILLISFNFPPKGWAFCNGQLLPINQNQALFSILGTTYGGNGQTTFALPDLRGRVPVHRDGQGLFVLGQHAGEEQHTVTASELPAHGHLVAGSSDTADRKDPGAHHFGANSGRYPYGAAPSVGMSPASVTSVGGSQPHENRSPFLVLNYVIALQGVFPSQN
jgi:microcystin-dependent protein